MCIIIYNIDDQGKFDVKQGQGSSRTAQREGWGERRKGDQGGGRVYLWLMHGENRHNIVA